MSSPEAPAGPSPLVYSCSGCSSAAQMTNWLAVRLDRLGQAEMSCIAGVGGDVAPLVRKARSVRPVIVLDGCPLDCARHCLARHDIVPTLHYRLSDMGVVKRLGEDFTLDQAEEVLQDLLSAVEAVRAGAGSAPADAVPA